MSTPSNIAKLECYRSPYGLYFKDLGFYWWTNNKVNGKFAVESHSPNWKLLEGEQEVVSVTRTVKKYPEVLGYKLVDQGLSSDKIPNYLTLEDVNRVRDDDGDWVWGNHQTLRSLYTEELSEEQLVEEPVEFEVKYLGDLSVGDLEAPHKEAVFIFSPSGSWAKTEPKSTTVSSLAEYQEIVRAVVPDLLIHNQPCKIPSHVAYQIVRAFIKNNIDLKQATITSDYDFCFTVMKKVSIKPVDLQKEIKTARGKSYRPPRYKTVTKTHRDLEIFEMTHSKENYRGYTPIAEFVGCNLKDLVENIQAYLEDVINYINTPLKECEHCQGMGHIVGEKFKINLRGG